MSVVGQQCPCIAGGLGFRHQFAEPFKKIVPVFIISEYLSTLYSPYNYMVQYTRGIQFG
jgi:hypothetical protein